MSVNTRRSSRGHGLAFLRLPPVPDGSIGVVSDESDRRHLRGLYAYSFPIVAVPGEFLIAELFLEPALTFEELVIEPAVNARIEMLAALEAGIETNA